jgi:hypothetical protein
MHEEDEKSNQDIIAKTERKRPEGRPRCKWEDGCYKSIIIFDWIHVAH